MAYFGDVWKNLVFSAYNDVFGMVTSLNYRLLKQNNSPVQYIRPKLYDNILIFEGKRMAVKMATEAINQLYPQYLRFVHNKLQAPILQQQEERKIRLIQDQKKVNADFGKLSVNNNKNTIYAHDMYGNVCPEALMLYFETDHFINVTGYQRTKDDKVNNGIYRSFPTKTLCFWDALAVVVASSGRRVISTAVQGRDFTRKEIIGGNDVEFSITGKIVGKDMGVYPADEVSKFIELVQHNGIINVHHYLFSQFNYTRVVIKKYSLDKPSCRNEQPYTITCVGVEPDTAVQISEDTAGALNQQIQVNELEGWYKFLFNKRWGGGELMENVASAGASILTDGVGLLGGL